MAKDIVEEQLRKDVKTKEYVFNTFKVEVKEAKDVLKQYLKNKR